MSVALLKVHGSLVICEQRETSTLDEVAKHLYSQIHEDVFSVLDYFVFVGCNFREKNTIGVHTLSSLCCKTAPTAISEASVFMR